VDNAYGDRHFVCSCPPLEDYVASAGGMIAANDQSHDLEQSVSG
jgi:hypothetical protein